jgi:menaquinone-dependent protoporphyrinogen oxidase
MTRVLITYGSRHGSTREVAAAIAARLRSAGQDVDLLPAKAAAETGPTGYDCVVVGGSLYMGRWHRDSCEFVRRHREAFVALPLAVFALGPRTLEARDVADSREQLDRALVNLGVEPTLATIFGGAVDPAKLHFPLNRLPASDVRDWHAVNEWSEEIRAVTLGALAATS